MLLTVSGMPAETEIQKLLTSAHMEEWLQHDLFHLRWWLLLGLSIFVVAVWWKLLDKRRLPEIILYAVLMMLVMMGVDEYGEELTLWNYPFDLLPIFPVITAINLWILPLAFSLVYQNCSTRKSFALTTVLVAAFISFVFEPALTWWGYYQLLKWQYYYSFLVYLTVSFFIRWIVVRISSIGKKAKKQPC
ncbi:CBO0543 family protein [Acetonema longum]|uniref:Uncharacterized protein n=1 Tax=Acetonema longum DSM 6540 TaxID=1009370 RepID=F7NLH3_9FIRM|nr:CBO0543 family protein [Acetonema longum]EGO63116.1 hypothetical protein ALO_14727 [Acetonema longum DSM 6540]